MLHLQWILKLNDNNPIKLSIADAEELGVDRVSTVGEIREMIQPKRIEPRTAQRISDTDARV